MLHWIRGHTHWSLRRQLVFSLGLVGLVPLLVLLCLSIPFLRHQIETSTTADYREHARVLGIGVGLMLEEALAELEQVSCSPDLRKSFETKADLNEAISYLASVLARANGRYLSFRLVDQTGQTFAEVGEGGHRVQLSSRPPPWSRRRATPWVDEVVPGPTRGSYLVGLATPIVGRSGRAVGYLMADYDAYRLLAQASHTSFGTAGVAGLVNHTGLMVYQQNGLRDRFVVTPLIGSASPPELQSQVGHLFRDDVADYLQAVAAVADAANLPGSLAADAPFSVLVAEPYQAVMARADDSLRWLLGSGFVVIVVLCVAASFLARRISRPLRELTRRVSEMGNPESPAGDPDSEATNEVVVLNNTFDAMRRRVIQHQRVLQERHVELQDAVQRLQAADRLKDEFLSFLSHEVKTPLSAIRSFAELLRSTSDIQEEDRAEFLTIIEQECNRLTRLSGDLLDFAMIDAGDMPWRDAPLDPGEVAEAVLRTMHVLAARSRIHLHLRRDPELPLLCADRDRITQLLTNLISNALKYTPANGQVTMRLKAVEGGRCLDLTVQDTGPGVPEGYHEKIFERFVRVQDRQRIGPVGTGLGLTICRRIVDHYGGRIHAENHEGGGAVFHVRLPGTAVQESTPEETDAPAQV